LDPVESAIWLGHVLVVRSMRNVENHWLQITSPVQHCYFENYFEMASLMLTSGLWHMWSFSVRLSYGVTQF